MKTPTYNVSPIGYVQAQNGSFALKIDQKYIPALQELGGFSHVNVFWWGHLYDTEEGRGLLQCEQPYKNAPATIGVFATRSSLRPNPIAVTPTTILTIDYENGVIQIPFIDAEDGTPILDLKPYHPCVDRIRDVSVPEWCSHWPQWYEDSAHFDWASEFVNAQ